MLDDLDQKAMARDPLQAMMEDFGVSHPVPPDPDDDAIMEWLTTRDDEAVAAAERAWILGATTIEVSPEDA